MDVVARAATFDHVAGQSEGSAAETDDRQLLAKMLYHFANGFSNVAQLGAAVGLKGVHIGLRTQRLFDHRALSGSKAEGQTHDLKGQQEIGKDDGGVHIELFSSGDGDIGGDFRGLTNI